MVARRQEPVCRQHGPVKASNYCSWLPQLRAVLEHFLQEPSKCTTVAGTRYAVAMMMSPWHARVSLPLVFNYVKITWVELLLQLITLFCSSFDLNTKESERALLTVAPDYVFAILIVCPKTTQTLHRPCARPVFPSFCQQVLGTAARCTYHVTSCQSSGLKISAA